MHSRCYRQALQIQVSLSQNDYLYVHLDAKNATTVMADKYMTQRGFSDHIGFVSVYDTGRFFLLEKVVFYSFYFHQLCHLLSGAIYASALTLCGGSPSLGPVSRGPRGVGGVTLSEAPGSGGLVCGIAPPSGNEVACRQEYHRRATNPFHPPL